MGTETNEKPATREEAEAVCVFWGINDPDEIDEWKAKHEGKEGT